MNSDVSICGVFSVNRKDSCGYCHTDGNAHSYGMNAYTLTVDDYQALIDRGWRRSGTYLYKPLMNVSCCPAYTIKCEIDSLKLSKSQKKILKKFNHFLCTDGKLKPSNDEGSSEENFKTKFVSLNFLCCTKKDEPIVSTAAQTDKNSLGESSKMSCSQESMNKPAPSKGQGADPSKAPCKKAKQIRAEKREQRLKAKGIDVMPLENVSLKEKSIEDFIQDLPGALRKKLEVKLVKSSALCKEPNEVQKAVYDLYLKYQMIIHNDPPEKCSWNQFARFLVKSPLKSETRGEVEYGSFQQQYWLDDKLIAVGIIDILPKCVSSVYFYYDPEYNDLNLGTYGALREIAFTRALKRIAPNIEYFYMGFYIHSCVKMRYKANFLPSYLLCPETYRWFPIKEACEKIDKEKYSRLNDDIDAIDADHFTADDVDNIPILDVDNSACKKFHLYKRALTQSSLRSQMSGLTKYGEAVGKACSKRIVMYLY